MSGARPYRLAASAIAHCAAGSLQLAGSIALASLAPDILPNAAPFLLGMVAICAAGGALNLWQSLERARAFAADMAG